MSDIADDTHPQWAVRSTAMATAGHRPAPDDAEVEAYLEQALHAPPPQRVESEAPEHPDTVVILDFGSQFAQLIARRVRELNVYSELLPHDTPMAELERRGARAVILSGGPSSATTPMPSADPALWSGRTPGARHLLRPAAHGTRARRRCCRPRSEYGPATVTVTDADGLFAGIEREQPVWMSHGDRSCGRPRASSRPPRPSRRRSPDSTGRNLYGIQFHPEVVHTPVGRDVLHLVVGIAGVRPNWTASELIETTVAGDERVGPGHVICALSGGVAGAVAATSCIGPSATS